MQIISKKEKDHTVVVFHLQMDLRASVIKVRDLGDCLC